MSIHSWTAMLECPYLNHDMFKQLFLLKKGQSNSKGLNIHGWVTASFWMLITYKKTFIVIIIITKSFTTHLDRKPPCTLLGTELTLLYKFTFVSRMSWSLTFRAQECNSSFAECFWVCLGPIASHMIQSNCKCTQNLTWLYELKHCLTEKVTGKGHI